MLVCMLVVTVMHGGALPCTRLSAVVVCVVMGELVFSLDSMFELFSSIFLLDLLRVLKKLEEQCIPYCCCCSFSGNVVIVTKVVEILFKLAGKHIFN